MNMLELEEEKGVVEEDDNNTNFLMDFFEMCILTERKPGEYKKIVCSIKECLEQIIPQQNLNVKARFEKLLDKYRDYI
ncbi:MAG: hypothetical protein QXD13_02575 [Candidatus Pacearchaeota archaeon]